MSEHICKPSCHNPCLLDDRNPYGPAEVAPSRSPEHIHELGADKYSGSEKNCPFCKLKGLAGAEPSEREAQDYAIEFGGYLANAAEQFQTAYNVKSWAERVWRGRDRR